MDGGRRDVTSTPMTTRWRRRRLVSEALDAYIEWRQRSIEADVAYHYWARASSGNVKLFYAVYLAALDHEEHASERLARLARRLDDLCTPGVDIDATFTAPLAS